MAHILLIDDDAILRETFGGLMRRLGHALIWAGSMEEGRLALSRDRVDVVLLDLRLPDGYGLDMMDEIKAAPGTPEVIIITGQEDPEGAALAIKSGAWDYIQKPLTPHRVTLPLTRALEYRLQKAARRPRAVLKREAIVGSCPAMEACLDLVAQAADSDASVLITGETGTGKELFARAIHDNSERADGPFVVVDCSSLTETLIESVLFGHAKGAFTGAEKKQEGLIKQADKGTLFLDEVGELPMSQQKAFLRVLQEHRFRPVGAKEEETSDFRLVAATNKDLEILVAGGDFRNDLLFRLRTMHLNIPALRYRGEDIRELAIHYMNAFCKKYKVPLKGFSPEFLDSLEAYDWPGNVRELVNLMENIIVRAQYEPTLYPKHLPAEIRIRIMSGRRQEGITAQDNELLPVQEQPGSGQELVLTPFDDYKKDVEHRYFKLLMQTAGGDIHRACELSELGKQSLYRYLRIHGIPTRA